SDLLDISRIAHGKFALDRERFDLAEAVTRLVNVWRLWGRFERHNVALHTSPVWIDADRARLDQITANLLDNALKFTPTGKTVHVTVDGGSGVALLRVADEGVGLAPEARQRIFELFVQEGPAVEGGLGIGLALVKRLAELHVGSAAGGARAPPHRARRAHRLRPDRRPPARLRCGLRRASREAGECRSLEARHRRAAMIILVEDDADQRLALKMALELAGYPVR